MDRFRRKPEERDTTLTLDQWATYFSYMGTMYGVGSGGTLTQSREEVGGDFQGYIRGAYKSNGIIFACMLARMRLFRQVRFQFQQMSGGRPGRLFGTPALELLERPWPNGVTSDLLARMIQDADLAGNFYGRGTRRGIERLRPDWMTIVLGGPSQDWQPGDLGGEIAGYLYQPGGPSAGRDPVPLRREEVIHFAPIPDPEASFRGMSWLTPVVREILADGAATTHKLKFFENGATPNMVVKLDVQNVKQFREWVEEFKDQHESVDNAYKTLFLAAGSDATVVGADLKQIDFKVTQGAGETRIAAAAGVPPIVVGLSEGLESATYSNYGQARRAFSDLFARDAWGNAAASLETIVAPPTGARLWYDERDVSFLQDDQKDAAEVQQAQASAISTFITAGFTPESAVDAVVSGDYTRLSHTGMTSVQLHTPGESMPAPATNGNGQPQLPATT